MSAMLSVVSFPFTILLEPTYGISGNVNLETMVSLVPGIYLPIIKILDHFYFSLYECLVDDDVD